MKSLSESDLNINFDFLLTARVAKLVDAPSSGGGVRKNVLVRIQSRAQIQIHPLKTGFKLQRFIIIIV